MPLILDAPPPAIIQPARLVEVRFGLSYAVSRVEYDRFRLPSDWREASLDELRAWVPSDLRQMPDGVLRAMFPFVPVVGFSGLDKTTALIITTDANLQTWSVPADWNSADNTAEVVSHGAHGSDGFEDCCGFGDGEGGGGGGYSKTAASMSLTPGGSASFRLSAANSGSSTGVAAWFNGATLAASSVGICGASGTNGASIGSAIGTNKRSGGNGAGTAGAGGGAGGDVGNGGNASGQTGGTSGGSHSGAGGAGSGGAGGLYGGGGGGGVRVSVAGGPGQAGIIVVVNNASL